MAQFLVPDLIFSSQFSAVVEDVASFADAAPEGKICARTEGSGFPSKLLVVFLFGFCRSRNC
jgi:hypothetical protein